MSRLDSLREMLADDPENWKRPRYEVWTLMNLLKEYLRKELERLQENGIRLRVLGRWRELDCCYRLELEDDVFWRLGAPAGKAVNRRVDGGDE